MRTILCFEGEEFELKPIPDEEKCPRCGEMRDPPDRPDGCRDPDCPGEIP